MIYEVKMKVEKYYKKLVKANSAQEAIDDCKNILLEKTIETDIDLTEDYLFSSESHEIVEAEEVDTESRILENKSEISRLKHRAFADIVATLKKELHLLEGGSGD